MEMNKKEQEEFTLGLFIEMSKNPAPTSNHVSGALAIATYAERIGIITEAQMKEILADYGVAVFSKIGKINLH